MVFTQSDRLRLKTCDCGHGYVPGSRTSQKHTHCASTWSEKIEDLRSKLPAQLEGSGQGVWTLELPGYIVCGLLEAGIATAEQIPMDELVILLRRPWCRRKELNHIRKALGNRQIA